jgi:hypothetical protein
MTYCIVGVPFRDECQTQFVEVRKGVPKLARGFKEDARRYMELFNGRS